MKAKYLIRFDDACPTMNRTKWDRIESLMDQYCIKPLIAVIPDNRDPDFLVDEGDSNFWEKVKLWQSKGWTIAMHGFQHKYETNEGGLVPLDTKSEFAGLSEEVQREKIKSAWRIFLHQGITPAVWIAPSHSFDTTTLKMLREETSIRILSDGIAVAPFYEQEFLWIPQQLWNFRKIPFGTWTICRHPATMNEIEFIDLENILRAHASEFISFQEIEPTLRSRNIFEKVFSWLYFLRRGFKKL